MKKLILVWVLGLMLTVTATFADHPDGWGVGVVGNYGWGWDSGYGGGALSLKVPSIPIFWGISLDPYYYYLGIGVTADWYFIDDNLVDTLIGWYLGGGLYANLRLYNSYYSSRGLGLGVGGRLPIGISFQIPISSVALELFIAAVPQVGIGLDFIKGNKPRLNWGVGGEFGVRVWF